MAINALTISGPIAGEHAIIVQDNGDTVMVHHGSVSMGLRKETLDAYRSDYAGLVSFLKDILHGDAPEVDKLSTRLNEMGATSINVFPGEQTASPEAIAKEINRGLDALENGDCEDVPDEAEETDKERADRMEAALKRIADESREHFATSIAMETLQGWDPRG